MQNKTGQKPRLTGLAKLFKVAFDGQDLTQLGTDLLNRAQTDVNDAEALMDLSIVLQLKYQKEIALGVQAQALKIKTHYCLPAEGTPSIKLLALMAPGDITTNTPLEFLVENSSISLDMIYIGQRLPLPKTLPEHDVAFLAIGESTDTRPILEGLTKIVDQWPCPLLNQPRNILKTSREAAPDYLASVDSIVMPSSQRIGRKTLKANEIPSPPFIIRPVDSHAGRGLAKIERISDLNDYLSKVQDSKFFISPFIDYRSSDGLYRKYRVVLISGIPYACHMGISQNWMIHYLNAGMTESEEKRREEEKFMTHFDTDFALRHQKSLKSLQDTFDLDYLVIDCGEMQDGKLLIFEIDTGAVVHAMDPPDIFPYKIPQMKKVFSAFHDMLARVANDRKDL